MAAITQARLLGTVVLAGAASTCALARSAAVADRASEPVSQVQIASSVPAPETLRWAALGHNEAMADLVWLNALSFFGAYRHLDPGVNWLDPHIEAVAALDPRFRIVYEWAGAVIMYGGTIDRESVMASNRFLERGVERFPLDWSIRFMLGANYAFELVGTTPEEHEEFRRIGAEHIAIAASLPNAPPALRLATSSMMRRRAGWTEQARVARDAYLSTPPANAVSMRVSVENTLPAVDAADLISQRQLLRVLDDDPRWGLAQIGLLAILFPEPTYMFTPAQIAPPSLPETR